MPVPSWTSSTDSPPRRACWTRTSRPSCGVPASARNALASSVVGVPSRQWNSAAPFVSVDRSAFWRASVKLRPMAIASPTLFIVVVRVGSAAGNFSKAKRGTLTTT